MKTKLISTLIFCFIMLTNYMHSQTNEFKIGIFGFNYMKNSTWSCTNLSHQPITNILQDGHPSSHGNVLSSDGFNIVTTEVPNMYDSSPNFVSSLLELVKNNNLQYFTLSRYYYKPNTNCIGGTNVYDNNLMDINSNCKARPNYEQLFLEVYSNPAYSDVIWGHHITEEASHDHFYNPTDVHIKWDDSLNCETEVPPGNVSDAIEFFNQQLDNYSIKNQKLVCMEAHHHRSIHDNTFDGSGYSPQDYLNIENKPDVFFEGSYTQFRDYSWEEEEYSNISASVAEDHYLGPFKSIDYAYTKVNEVHKVITVENTSVNPTYFQHYHSDPLIENANWLWFQAYTSIIHGAKGIWFWNLGRSKDSTETEPVGDDRFEEDNFPDAYNNYIRHLSRELRYLVNNNILSSDTRTIVYTKRDHFDSNGIVPPINDYINLNHITPSEFSILETEHINTENYGLRYTVRSNGKETIMIITNPLNVAIQNIELDFSNVSNSMLRYATSVEVLFERTDYSVTHENYKETRDGDIDLVLNTVGEKYPLPLTNNKLYLSFGPMDTHVLKFISEPVSYDNNWEKVWSNMDNNHIDGWGINDNDKFYPGDFDGDGKEELLCVQTDDQNNDDWMTVLYYENDDWQWGWSNYGDPTSGDNIYEYRHNLVMGDFDNDGKDEVLGNDTPSGKITLFEFENHNWHEVASNNGSSGNWAAMSYFRNKLLAGDFNNDGKDEVLGVGDYGMKLFSFSGGTFSQLWYGDSSHDMWIYRDDFKVGDFNGDGKDEILGNDLPNGWITRFTYENGNFQWGPWSTYGNFHDLLDYRENFYVGDYDNDGKDEILGFPPPGGWITMFDFENNEFQWSWSTNGKTYLDDWNPNENINDSYYYSVKIKKDAADNLIAIRKNNHNHLVNIYSFLPENFFIYGSNTGESDNFDVQYGDGEDVAFLFYIPHWAKVTVTTCDPETNFDTKLEIFHENGTTTGEYNDDAEFCSYYGTASTISTELPEGYYYIVVDGYNGATGDFGISISLEYIYTVPFTVNGTNIGETDDFDLKYTDGQDKAYKFYLPSNSTIKADLCNQFIDYDSKIEIFHEDGTSTGAYNYNNPGCNYSPHASTINSFSLNGGYYYAVVDGIFGYTGQFQLSVTEVGSARRIELDNNKETTVLNDLSGSELTEIKPLKIKNINVYPNPAVDFVTVECLFEEPYEIELINIKGEILKQIKTSDQKVIFDVTGIESGVYLLRFLSSNDYKQVKIVISK